MARLVDAKELENQIKTVFSESNPVLMGQMLRWIRKQQTIDAVPVVHGRWIRRGNEMKCSRCLFIYYSNHDYFNYCPNCGAKNDGERKDNG